MLNRYKFFLIIIKLFIISSVTAIPKNYTEINKETLLKKIEMIENQKECINNICDELVRTAEKSSSEIRGRIGLALINAGPSSLVPIYNFIDDDSRDELSYNVWLELIVKKIGPAGIPISIKYLKTMENPRTIDFVTYYISSMDGQGNDILLNLLEEKDTKSNLIALKSLSNISNLNKVQWEKIFSYCLNSQNEEIIMAATELIFKYYYNENVLINLFHNNIDKWEFMQIEIIYAIGEREHIGNNLKNLLIEIIGNNKLDDQVRAQALFSLNQKESNKEYMKIIIGEIMRKKGHQNLKGTACNILRLNGDNSINCDNLQY